MASKSRPQRGVSHQRCRDIILQYDRLQNSQSVIWVGEFGDDKASQTLLSSFVCPPGQRAVHEFSRKIFDGSDLEYDFEIDFAVEEESYRILFEVRARTKKLIDWISYGLNYPPHLMALIPRVGNQLPPGNVEQESHENNSDEPCCPNCNEALVCLNCCEFGCGSCGGKLTCEKCDNTFPCQSCGETKEYVCSDCVLKEAKMAAGMECDPLSLNEKLQALDAEVLQMRLVRQVEKFELSPVPWTHFLNDMLVDADSAPEDV